MLAANAPSANGEHWDRGDEPSCELALLRQKAAALEAEISRRKEVEEKLLRREAELRDFIEGALRGSESKLQEELADAKLLQNISAALTSEQEVEALYEKLVDAAMAIMRSDFASMQMFDPEHGNAGALRLLAFRGFQPQAAKTWEWVNHATPSSCAEALRTGQRVIVSDIKTCAFLAGTYGPEAYLEAGIHAVQSTPLLSRSGKLVGMISTHWRNPHQPTERELRLLDILARQAADLMERRLAERALRESEEKYRELARTLQRNEERFRLAAFSDAITLYEQDADLRYTWLYPLHREHENALGKSDTELLQNEQGELLARWKREVMATGKPQRREIRMDLSSAERTYDVFIVPKRDAAGTIVGVAGTALDISERNRAETALRESEERFRAVIDNSPTIVFVKDCAGRYVLINQRYKELFHTTEEAFVGKTDFENFPAEIAQKYRENDLIVMQTGQALAVEEVAVHEDGPHTYISTKFPLRRADGTIYAVAGISNDITERKRAEESAARLAAIVEHSNDAIIGKDLKGIIKSWNIGAERLFGYTVAEALGQPVTILIPEGCLNEEPKILERIRRGESIENYETVRRRKDGTLLDISLTVSPVKDSKGNVIGASKVARDITDKVRAKEKLEQTVAERTASLREAIAQMEEFSYTVSHDLRAPLRGMQAYAEALLQDYAGSVPKEAADYLERIARNAARLDRMILDVLTFTRVARAEVRLARVDTSKLVREVLEQYPGTRGPDVRIEVKPLHDVMGHEASLAQALSNLLSNSVKFVRPGVSPKVSVWSECREGRVRIWIADNGIGVDPQYQHRLFSMFERIHPNLNYEGTGVGLAIVRKAMERMGGRAGMESDGVNGSRFWIELRGVDAK